MIGASVALSGGCEERTFGESTPLAGAGGESGESGGGSSPGNGGRSGAFGGAGGASSGEGGEAGETDAARGGAAGEAGSAGTDASGAGGEIRGAGGEGDGGEGAAEQAGDGGSDGQSGGAPSGEGGASSGGIVGSGSGGAAGGSGTAGSAGTAGGGSSGCPLNACGGCSVLPALPGDDCGACGEYACNGPNALVCSDPGYLKPVAIAGGYAHACALLENGTVRCWGENALGQLGVSTPVESATAVRAGSFSGATGIAAGSEHSCALLADGKVYCWGSNSHGQLGDGTKTSRSNPLAVSGLSNVDAVHAGGNDSCAISDGGLRCWGDDTHNQFADIPSPPCWGCTRTAPVAVRNDVASVAINSDFICVVTTSGGLRCWGDHFYGQTLGATWTPPGSDQASGVLAVSSGINPFTGIDVPGHACALLGSGGGVRCWGACLSKECGPGVPDREIHTYPSSNVFTGAVALAVGAQTVCVVHQSEEVVCWGGGATEMQLPGLSGVTAIAAGANHHCAIALGAVHCWGSNESGQLGGGTVGGSSAAPVRVQGLAELCE